MQISAFLSARVCRTGGDILSGSFAKMQAAVSLGRKKPLRSSFRISLFLTSSLQYMPFIFFSDCYIFRCCKVKSKKSLIRICVKSRFFEAAVIEYVKVYKYGGKFNYFYCFKKSIYWYIGISASTRIVNTQIFCRST